MIAIRWPRHHLLVAWAPGELVARLLLALIFCNARCLIRDRRKREVKYYQPSQVFDLPMTVVRSSLSFPADPDE